MNDQLIGRAAALPARQLHLIGAGLLLATAAALWFYGMRAPLVALQLVRAEQARLEGVAADPRALDAQLAVVDLEASALSRRLGAPSGSAAPGQLVELVADVGALARASGVRLRTTTPAPEEQVMAFVQVGIDADATGRYQNLLAWIAALERARPNLSVTAFDMAASTEPGMVEARIRISAYRPQGSTP